MTAEAIVAVSAAVVALTQLAKWQGISDRYGPIAVMVFALAGVLFWGWSNALLSRATAFGFFAGWLAVTTSASGVYGFSRASGEALTRLTAPPTSGAGSEATVKHNG
jgi:hypothetical protein